MDIIVGKALSDVVTLGEVVTPRKGKRQSLKIMQRFHFSSALKRMSTIASHQTGAVGSTTYFAAVKGAPEIVKTMVYVSWFVIQNNYVLMLSIAKACS